MKILINKLKKTNKIFLSIYLLTFIIYVIFYIFFVLNIGNLSGIETALRITLIVIFGIWLLVYFFWNLINLLLKRHITLSIVTAITVIFIVLFGFFNHYMKVLYTGINNLTEKDQVEYTANLITLKDTKINGSSKLGMINSSEDIEGNVLAKELIKKEKLDKNEVISYSSYYELIYDLLNKEIDGIFLSSNYMTIFGGEDEFKDLKDTIVAYTYSKKMENRDTNIISNKSLTEPFTVLLMGVDSSKDGLDANTAFNGDTLMLITFNPKTLNATMFSIPRDTYVPIACNNNRHAKINSSAAYGTSCVMDTIKELTGVEIDYYLKVNFKGVVDLVEALGGVDVDVEAPDYSYYIKAYNGRICEQDSKRKKGSNLVCMDTGKQHLNGEQALAYARNRHGFLQSDIARNRHQQQIVEALAKKIVDKNNINRIEEILSAITNNLATNMSQKQILSFYDVMKNMIANSFNEGDFITIQKTYLEYYSLPVKLSNNGNFTSAIGYYPDSLEAIVKLMNVNLGLLKKEEVKTFNFNANEEFEENIVGKGITTGDKLETMPNLVGSSITKAEAWANEHNIEFKTKYVDTGDKNYNDKIAPGLVSNQSVSQGILVNNIKSITFYINNAPVKDDDKTNDKNDNKNDKPNNNKPNNNKPNTGNNTNNNTTNTNKPNTPDKEQPKDDEIDESLNDILPSPGEDKDKNDDLDKEKDNE